jgi:hypothetical protein
VVDQLQFTSDPANARVGSEVYHLAERSKRRAIVPNWTNRLETQGKEDVMAKGQQRGNRETKKPKKEKPKVIAAAPNRKIGTWQPDLSAVRKK